MVGVYAAVNSQREAGDHLVSLLEFSPSPNADRRYGCDWRSGLNAQRELAEALGKAIADQVGWRP